MLARRRAVIFFVFSAFELWSASFTSLKAEPAPGPDYICVRNFYAGVSEAVAEDVMRQNFVRVQPADRGNGVIFTKSYSASFCSASPREFKWVMAASGEKICTCDFHQEGVAEYCYSNPKIFAWALKAD
jgi:hypothetical protein